MRFLVLGTLEVHTGDGTEDGDVTVGGPTPRRLLTALLADVGNVVPMDALVAAAWGEHPPRSVDKTLQSHLARLRESLAATGEVPAPRIERRGDGYLLRTDPAGVDAVEFQRLVRDAEDRPAGASEQLLTDALALWRGPLPYGDLQNTAPPVSSHGLLQLRDEARLRHAAALLSLGRGGHAAAELELLLASDPYRERAWELLVRALYVDGRQADALEAVRRARRCLVEELGVEPGPVLRHLQRQVLTHDPSLLDNPPWSRTVLPCPYMGLSSYEPEDAPLYVGREALVNDLLGRLVDGRLVVVTGPSGSGKSSVLRAGLIPALAAGVLPGSAGWKVHLVVPGRRSGSPEPTSRQLDVLVLDQAEEAVAGPGAEPAQAFGEHICAVLEAGTRVVLGIRTDFYGRLTEHRGLARRAGPATVLVSPPDEKELRRIITEPAVRSGLRVDPALVEHITGEVRGRPGALPVLSTALVRTWEHLDGDRLTLEAYRAGGGVSGALQRVGEDVWAGLSAEQKEICRRIMLRLATLEDERWVRRRAIRSEVCPPGDESAATTLRTLSTGRLVVAQEETVEISHEALLTGWSRLNGWLEDSRSMARVREQLAQSAADWAAADHDPEALYRGARLQAATSLDERDLTSDERAFLQDSARTVDREIHQQRERADREARGRRRLRGVVLGLVIALGAVAVLGGLALRQQRAAQRATTAARDATSVADAGRLGALASSGSAVDENLLLAVQALRLAPGDPSAQSNLFETLEANELVTRSLGAGSHVTDVAASPDGRTVVVSTGNGRLYRFDPVSGRHLSALSVGRPVGHVGWTRDGIVVGLTDGPQGPPFVETVDPVTGVVRSTGPRADPYAWTYTTGGRWLVSTDYRVIPDSIAGYGESTGLVVWRPGASRPAGTVPLGGHVDAVSSCGTSTACVLQGTTLRRVRLPDGPVSMPVHLSGKGTGLVSPAGGKVLAIGYPGFIELREARTGAVLRRLTGAEGTPYPLAFSPDGSRLSAADSDGSVLVWDVRSQALPVRLAHAGGVAAWLAGGSRVVTNGGGVLVWDLDGRRAFGKVLTRSLPGDGQFPTHNSTAWGARGTVAVGGRSGWLAFLDEATGRMTVPRSPHRHPIATARSGRSGRTLVSTDESGVTAVWDVASRRLLGLVHGLPTPDGRHGADAWVSPDGKLAATFRDARGPVVFDVAQRSVVRRLPPLPGDRRFNSYVDGWSEDGTKIAVIRQRADQTGVQLLLVDARSGRVRLRIDAPMGAEGTLDPHGRWIALGGFDGKLRFYSQHTGRPIAPTQQATAGPIFNVSTTPDGRYIVASGGASAVVPVFDTRTFRQSGVDLPVPQPGDPMATRTRFTPDHKLIVVEGREVQLFPMDPAQWVSWACTVAGRDLTRDEWRGVLPRRPYQHTCPRSTTRPHA